MVSILMVARNSAAFIDAALLSARAQSYPDIEIIVVDDGSDDGTPEIVGAHAREDRRVRLCHGPGAGLAAVRNASLRACRGPFAAILDSDDILHPRHVELLMAGRTEGAAICISNMVSFQVRDGCLQLAPFATGEDWQNARAISIEEFTASGMIGYGGVSLGYMKPLFDMAFIRRHRLEYDERLRIGEDFDLVLRAMLAGARTRYLPEPSYFYRRHASSTSHRLGRDDLEGLIEATKGLRLDAERYELRELLDERHASLQAGLRHLDAVDALKAGRWHRAIGLMAREPLVRQMTLRSLHEAAGRRFGQAKGARGLDPWIDGREGSEALRQIEAAMLSAAAAAPIYSLPRRGN